MQTGKQIIAALLLSLLFIKAMIVPAIFVNYELRKDFIIQNYCVNKDMPELHCDGQCYLAKQLKAAQQEDEKQATNTFLTEVFKFESKVGNLVFLFEPKVSTIENKTFRDNSTALPSSGNGSVFHPPQA
ncbi:hypothetical protein [Jiulongibacter sediminis]|uniref:hypothetical protein n=1 Tax=Jiulongibacter sediminis TaxID=1605367 RepID=UPI0006DCD037|nr:hypothetical protein [Jiulongibacter sediminis]